MFFLVRKFAQKHKNIIQDNFNYYIKIKLEYPINIWLKAGKEYLIT